MKSWLRPLSYLYGQMVERKNARFDRQKSAIHKPSVPVISIGNLTAGGTGKTPITDLCLKYLVADGKKVGVISRSYKADAGSACPVDISHPFAARYYGDEPVLLAKKNPEVTVFVGPRKWQTAHYAEGKERFDVLVVDDGFQHRRLHRDLDIVILDATEDLDNYALLPEGRARESWHNLSRASVLLLTKCNLVDEAQLKALTALLPPEKEVLHFGYQIDSFKKAQDGQLLRPSDLRGKKLFLVSAIARPDVFEKMLGDMGVVAEESLHFRDHHQYGSADIKKILTAFKQSHADYLITTEKDLVKLSPLVPLVDVWSASLQIVELSKKGRLHEIVSQTLR